MICCLQEKVENAASINKTNTWAQCFQRIRCYKKKIWKKKVYLQSSSSLLLISHLWCHYESSNPGLCGVPVTQSLGFYASSIFIDHLFVLLSQIFWPLYYLSFDLQLLITPLVSLTFFSICLFISNIYIFPLISLRDIVSINSLISLAVKIMGQCNVKHIIKDEVLITVGCPIFLSILIAGCSVHFAYCTPLFRREIFLLGFYFKFISILHRVNN
jgi:hypothetical protein